METFIFWVVIITIFLLGYSFYLIRKSPKGFRLQVKLTITFILLVLVPTIPLTLVVSALITQGVEIFLVPGVENSLANSLQVIKSQLEERGQRFIECNPDWSTISPSELKKFDVLFVSRYRLHNNRPVVINEIVSNTTIHPSITADTLSLILNRELTSSMNNLGESPICKVYRSSADSVISVVGFNVGPQIMLAKEQISQSLQIYKSLSLLKKSVIEGRLIWGIAALFIIILALIAIYAAGILSQGISHPIHKLASGMQRVSDGDFSSKVIVDAKDEIKILVDSFNKMAEDLKVSQQKLVQAERLAAWRDVARRVSHEIKNSLTPIQISLYRIKTKFFPGDQEIEQEPLLSIQDEIESLRRISEEFSQFARMPQIKREENDLNNLIKTLVPLVEGGSKPINIKMELDTRLSKLSIDRDQIKRVLHNLLKNSVEASSIGGKIFVRTTACENHGKKVIIEIEDQGHGMNEEVKAKIFKPYFTTRQRGMGLGLSIVKRIIEDHDGEISVETIEGKGTKVIIVM